MSQLVHYFDGVFYADCSPVWYDDVYLEAMQRHCRQSSVVLDIGAGRGANAALDISKKVGAFYAADVDEAVLENPQVREARLIDESGRVPYDDAMFDLVVSSYVLEHVENPRVFFQEVARVLKPGGHFVARTPNRWHYVPFIAQATPLRLHKYINYMRGRAMCDTFKTYYRANSSRRITALAEEVGLTVAEIGLHEGKPEYLRFNGLAYMLGIGYQRVASTRTFAGIRPLLICDLVKPATQ